MLFKRVGLRLNMMTQRLFLCGSRSKCHGRRSLRLNLGPKLNEVKGSAERHRDTEIPHSDMFGNRLNPTASQSRLEQRRNMVLPVFLSDQSFFFPLDVAHIP